MKQNSKIFTIVPIYNVGEKYIKKCVESLKSNINDNTFFIFINDGSKEWKNEKKEIPKKDNFIILENEKNIGLGPTRNVGIKYIIDNFEITKKDYILFLDSDDELTNNFIFKLNKIIKKHNYPDIVRFLFFYRKQEIYSDYFLPIFSSKKNERFKDFYDTSWSCAYNALWIKNENIFFDDSRFPHEDVYYCLISSSCASNIVSSNIVGYIYNFDRENSLTNLWNNKTYSKNDSLNYIKYISHYLESAFLFIKKKNNLLYLENAKFYFQKFEYILSSERLNNLSLDEYQKYANKIENIFKELNIKYWDMNKNIVNQDKAINNKINFIFLKKCIFKMSILYNLKFRKFTI